MDWEGKQRKVRTYAYGYEAIRRRRPEVLKAELEKRGMIRKVRIGNTRMMLVETADAITCVKEMEQQGIRFYWPA